MKSINNLQWNQVVRKR